MAEPFWHTYQCRVRWSDVDAYGHVNNVKYFEYFQEARIEFLSATVDARGPGENLVVAHLAVDYKLPIFFRSEPYTIRTRVTSRGESSLELSSSIENGEQVLSTNRAVLVAFDGAAQGSRPFTERERGQLDELIG